MDEKNEGGGHGRKKGQDRKRWVSGWKGGMDEGEEEEDHQKTGGRDDSDGSSRTASLEVACSVFVVVLRCSMTGSFCPSCVCLMFASS